MSGTIGELRAAGLAPGTPVAAMLEDRIASLEVYAGAAQADLRLLITIGTDRPSGATGFDELISGARSALEVSRRDGGDLAIVGYTSGTTGPPKGVILPHLYNGGTDGRRLTGRVLDGVGGQG